MFFLSSYSRVNQRFRFDPLIFLLLFSYILFHEQGNFFFDLRMRPRITDQYLENTTNFRFEFNLAIFRLTFADRVTQSAHILRLSLNSL